MKPIKISHSGLLAIFFMHGLGCRPLCVGIGGGGGFAERRATCLCCRSPDRCGRVTPLRLDPAPSFRLWLDWLILEWRDGTAAGALKLCSEPFYRSASILSFCRVLLGWGENWVLIYIRRAVDCVSVGMMAHRLGVVDDGLPFSDIQRIRTIRVHFGSASDTL